MGGNSTPFSYDGNKSIELPSPFKYYKNTKFDLKFSEHTRITTNDPVDLAVIDSLDYLHDFKAFPHTKVYAILKPGDMYKYLNQARFEWRYDWCEFHMDRGEYHLILFKPKRLTTRLWRGQKSGGSLFVYSEWGWGDLIRNLRFLKPLSEIFSSVIFEARHEIVSLASLYPVSIIPRGMPIPSHDFHIRIEEVDKHIPPFYERIPLPSIINLDKELNVGIVWQGGRLTLDKHRDFKVDFLKEVNSPTVNLWSFSVKSPLHLKPAIQNYDSWERTAQILSTMDLVISADTSLAHLAGGLGLKTIVLLPKLTYDTVIADKPEIWYPSMTVFQSGLDDWSDAYDYAKQQISNCAKDKSLLINNS